MSQTDKHPKTVTVMVVEGDKPPHIKRVPVSKKKLVHSAKKSRIRQTPNVALAKAIFG